MASRTTSPFMEKEYDDLDRKIDSFLGRLGAIFRFLIILGAVGALWYYILWPTIDTWGSYVGIVLAILFQPISASSYQKLA